MLLKYVNQKWFIELNTCIIWLQDAASYDKNV